MNLVERRAYEVELRRVAKNLKVPARGDIERSIIQSCTARVERWIDSHGRPSTLSGLLELTSGSLSIDFVEVSDNDDLESLLTQIPPDREPVMARLGAELDDQTDGIMIQRRSPERWERPFLAVINCRGWHGFRRYFTKWHEASHLLVDGPQLRFVFRRTPVPELRKDPGEILVDRVAAALAFYAPIFEPIFLEELAQHGQMGFDLANEVRERIAPDASRHSIILACIRCCTDPVYFIRCKLGYKREEERFLSSGQKSLFPGYLSVPEGKLRVIEAAPSASALELGVRVHKNMRVPESSVVAKCFGDPISGVQAGRESLCIWETSSGGPIGDGALQVEALSFGDEVWALLRIT